MKNLFILPWFVLFAFASCNAQSPFVIQDKANPWKDDYFDLSSMEHYKDWGTYNVHDPACKKIGDYYYMYSTDAIFAENKKEASEKGVPLGYIQVRRSKDLVNWEFVGWAFPEIPEEAVNWVRDQTNGRGATNIWAPYIMPYQNIYRLYFCVSAFGKQASYIGLAESTSPEGPWIQKGCVVKTDKESLMNAIDPSIIEDFDTGQWWMHYGSFFGGLYCVELNPVTGLPVKENDQGHLVARRANYAKDNLEAPEIMYHPGLKKYFLFSSYDPLMTTYNVRVGYSDKPEGPFFDFNGLNLKDTTNNFPILTAPYRFDNHPGWAGAGHCGIVNDGNGHFFMLHQARLSPYNALMVLHVRQVFFTPDGWPVVSPERYTVTPSQRFYSPDMAGEWEIIRILEPAGKRNLEAGQVLWGEGGLKIDECNTSFRLVLDKNGNIQGGEKWHFSDTKQLLSISLDDETIDNLIIFAGHDWENKKETILFTGLDKKGHSVWGKKIN
ncbi:MAG: arabinan endo-1,5-alpha-L-arabinosidase [Dysgonamonadaceae bacterium]|jgi:arabinan endo-1,5-alpha-L-arabinosidase|nr:arabinan endo-1,5-alpha-L-arabinosidase [Dysgonamonadaceae bacterium]